MPLLETLTDDFNTAGAPDAVKWPVATNATVSGGVLSITDSTGAYPAVRSAANYTIAGSYLHARVVPATPSGNNSQQTYISVDRDESNFVALMRDGANLVRIVRTGGVDAFTTIGTYNATTMAWWRIRHTGSAWVTGYSADGVTWTEQASFTTPWAVTDTMRATLMVGKWNVADANPTATWDSVNLTPPVLVRTTSAVGGTIATNVAGTISAAVPIDAAVGDVALFIAGWNGNTVPRTVDSAPAGWTLVGQYDNATGATSSANRLVVYAKEIAAGEPGSTVSIGLASAAGVTATVAAFVVFAGADLNSIVANVTGQGSTTYTTLAAAAAAPSNADMMSIAIVMANVSVTGSQPTSWAAVDAGYPIIRQYNQTSTAYTNVFGIGFGQPGYSRSFTATRTMRGGVSGQINIAAAAPVQNASLADGIALPVTLDSPSVAMGESASAGDFGYGTFGGGSFGGSVNLAATPDGLGVPVALDNPTAGFAYSATPDGLAVAVALDAPTVTFTAATTPDGLSVPVALDAPTATSSFDGSSTPDGLVVPVVLDAPTVEFTDSPDREVLPDGLSVPVALGPPSAAWNDTGFLSDGVALPVALDAPTVTFEATWAGSVVPTGLAVPVALTGPSVAKTTTYAATVSPASLGVRITLDGPTVEQTTDERQFVPPFVLPQRYRRPAPPLHLIGIGPANSQIPWRGAPNYGLNQPEPTFGVLGFPGTKPPAPIKPSPNQEKFPTIKPDPVVIKPVTVPVVMPSRPHMRMPPAQSMSFTLRLDGPNEARTDHELGREEAIFVQEMATDLWWRRRDPRRNTVDPIGRFNADKVDISSTATGVRMSVTWADYEALITERLFPDASQTWAKDAPVINVLNGVMPFNMPVQFGRLGSGILAGQLGRLREEFTAETGASTGELLTQLQAQSPVPWEWWIEMAPTDEALPVLALTAGFGTNPPRGTDRRGVVLWDIGSGQGPIESWQMQAASDKYANSLYYSGADIGVLVQLAADIDVYGQRDATASDSTVKGTTAAVQQRLRNAAIKELTKLSDRTPTWTLVLREGFWEGRSHIDVGDLVSVYVALGDDVIAGTHRVTEIQVDIDASGKESVTLTLGMPRPARDPRSRLSAISKIVKKVQNSTKR